MTTDNQVIIDMAMRAIHERHSNNQSVDLDAIRDNIEIELVDNVDKSIIKMAYDLYMKNTENNSAIEEQSASVSDGETIGQAHTQDMLHANIAMYDVIRKKHLSELVFTVRQQMKLGWVPLGGVGFAAAGMSPIGDTGNSFIQAIVKLG